MRIFWLTSLSLLMVIFFSQAFKIKEQRESIEGLWKIHSIEYFDSLSGKWMEHSWMKGGEGLLHYDRHRNMSLHFTPPGYQKSSDADLEMTSSDYWYIANYKILEGKRILEHNRIMHSKPSEWGKTVQRKFDFLGDTLVLSPVERNMRLKWIRVSESG